MYGIKTPIYQTREIRDLECLAEERFGISSKTMMQRAARAAFDFMLRRWPQAQRIAVFCGTGNNGGDGYLLAQLAHERGLKVTVWQVGNLDNIKGEAKNAFAFCRDAKVNLQTFHEKVDFQNPDLIVDAICGIGLHDNLRADVVTVIERIHRSQAPVFALDVPTGINADTGNSLGAAVKANATMTFIGLKLGLLTGNGMACAGELALNNLQLPPDLFSFVGPVAEKIHLSSYAAYLKPRSRDWHKGLSGHVLIIGGELGMSGAPRMAAEAALRVGAGLVSVATQPPNALVMNIACPEIMCYGVSQADQLAPLIERADVIILGPGLGQSAWAKNLWEVALQTDLPLVVDADALNLLAKESQQASKMNDNWVLTPHPGEAARLLNVSVEQVQQDRLAAIKMIHKNYGGTCVLKGAGSLVLSPSALPALCDKGNPGMASAGMGDILSGVIGGLIAQGVPLGDAAKLGVTLHAMAGDLAAKDGERGMMAMDLMPYLRRLANFNN